MPIVIFTANEMLDSTTTTARQQSAEILALSDLAVRPLDPGESPDARRHKIAKLGLQLARTFVTMDAVLKSLLDSAPDADHDPAPAAPSGADAN